MAADCALGLSIVAEAATRLLEVTAVAKDPTRCPVSVRVTRGDLLDLACPEQIAQDCDVLVAPFGSFDAGEVDFAADLHGAVALGRASERIARKPVRFVLAGRSRRSTDATGDRGGPGYAMQPDWHLLAEHAAVEM